MIAAKMRNAQAKEEEAELVRRVIAKDRAAQEQLFNSYKNRVFATANHYRFDTQDAEEIAQEVFIKVFKHIDKFRGTSTLGTWIEKIATNQCFDRMRKEKARPDMATRPKVSSEKFSLHLVEMPDADLDLLAKFPSEERPVIDRLSGRQLLEVVRPRISKSFQRYFPLLVLKEVQGWSIKEICELTALNENTLKVGLFRLRRSIRETVQQLNSDCGLSTDKRGEVALDVQGTGAASIQGGNQKRPGMEKGFKRTTISDSLNASAAVAFGGKR